MVPLSDYSRIEAINHVVDSARYWLQNDYEDRYPHYGDKNKSFNEAVEHVKYYHYPLTATDIEEARRKFFPESSNREL